MADSWRHSSRPPGNAIAPALGGIDLRSRISLTEAALAILMVGFFVAGVFGRFPWKADEPYSFGIVWKMLQTGDWLVPRVADQPFVEKPPLVYWLGALSARTMPGVPAHEASRVAVLMLGAVTLLSIVVAAARLWPEASRWRSSLALGRPERDRDGREWNRRDYAWLAVALAVGTLGWVEQVHKFTADLGQMAGAALALTGLVCISTRFCLTCLPGSAAT